MENIKWIIKTCVSQWIWQAWFNYRPIDRETFYSHIFIVTKYPNHEMNIMKINMNCWKCCNCDMNILLIFIKMYPWPKTFWFISTNVLEYWMKNLKNIDLWELQDQIINSLFQFLSINGWTYSDHKAMILISPMILVQFPWSNHWTLHNWLYWCQRKVYLNIIMQKCFRDEYLSTTETSD